jgi:AcrR family transcriptional regulator
MPKQTFFNLPVDKRQGIIDIAVEEFAENEYSQVSISRIVARAGIAKGSFYQYFADKKDLLFYLLEVGAQRKLELLRESPPPDPQMGMFAYISALVRAGTHFQARYPGLSRVAARALYGSLPFRDESLQHMKETVSHYFLELIEMGVARGDVDPGVNRQMAAFVLGAVFNELGNYFLRQIGWDPAELAVREFTAAELDQLDQIVTEALQLLRHGLGTKESC